MLTVTFIRHGESEDNTKAIWAGWKDAPLSKLGERQADALGRWYASTDVDHIYASPLLRAHSTGQAVYRYQPDPKPSFTVNPDLREQHFGVGEGYPWHLEAPEKGTMEELYAKKIFPVLSGRDSRFPEGESLNDLAKRAERAIRHSVFPHITAPSGSKDVHIVIASHGLCIAELVAALLTFDPKSKRNRSYAGLQNTAWTRVEVRLRDDQNIPFTPESSPSLDVKVTHINEAGHLKDLAITPPPEETGEEIEARAYFSGGGAGEKVPDERA